jgi:hypothetical protein
MGQRHRPKAPASHVGVAATATRYSQRPTPGLREANPSEQAHIETPKGLSRRTHLVISLAWDTTIWSSWSHGNQAVVHQPRAAQTRVASGLQLVNYWDLILQV